MLGIWLIALLISDAFTFGAADTGTPEKPHVGNGLGLYISSFDVMDNILQKLVRFDEKMTQLDVKLKQQESILLRQGDTVERIVAMFQILKNDFAICDLGMQKRIVNLNSKMNESNKQIRDSVESLRKQYGEDMMTSREYMQTLQKDMKETLLTFMNRISRFNDATDNNFRRLRQTTESIKSKTDGNLNEVTMQRLKRSMAESVMPYNEQITQKIANLKTECVAGFRNMNNMTELLRRKLYEDTKTNEESVQKLTRFLQQAAKQQLEGIENRIVNLKAELVSNLKNVKQLQGNVDTKITQKAARIEAVSALSHITPKNCAEVNLTRDGPYQLNVPTKRGDVFSFIAYCMLDPVDNCTRTLITRNVKKTTLKEQRSQAEYAEGFGYINGTYFMGLEKLKVLTNEQAYALYGIKDAKIVKECVELLIGADYNYKCTWELKAVTYPTKSTWIEEIAALASYDLAYIKPKKC